MYTGIAHRKSIDVATKSAIHLQLHADTICTACQYLHRFYDFMQKYPISGSNDTYDTGTVVATALYIASKTNENHIRLSELISSVHYHLTLQSNELPNYDNYELLPKDFNYWKLRDTVVQFELFMLRILEFKLTIDLPHKYLIFYLKSLSDWINNDSLMEELFTFAWSVLNDYFCNHPNSHKWQSNQTALSCIELAISTISPQLKSNIENRQTNKYWYANFDKSLKKEVTQSIIGQILSIFQAQNNNINTEDSEIQATPSKANSSCTT